jgi:hypothetical protein
MFPKTKVKWNSQQLETPQARRTAYPQGVNNVLRASSGGEIGSEQMKGLVKGFGASPAREPDYGKGLASVYTEFARNVGCERKSDRHTLHTR